MVINNIPTDTTFNFHDGKLFEVSGNYDLVNFQALKQAFIEKFGFPNSDDKTSGGDEGMFWNKDGNAILLTQVPDGAGHLFSIMPIDPKRTSACLSNTSSLISHSPSNTSNDQVTEAEFNRDFRCPESFDNEDQKAKALFDMVDWYGAHNKTVTPEGLLSFRMKVLEEHHCDVTLENIRRNNAVTPDQPVSQENNTALSPQGASFDCNKAHSVSEKLICSDPELSRLDNELATIYYKAKDAAQDKKAFAAENSLRWNQREQTCTDKDCLISWYTARKAELMGQ